MDLTQESEMIPYNEIQSQQPVETVIPRFFGLLKWKTPDRWACSEARPNITGLGPELCMQLDPVMRKQRHPHPKSEF